VRPQEREGGGWNVKGRRKRAGKWKGNIVKKKVIQDGDGE